MKIQRAASIALVGLALVAVSGGPSMSFQPAVGEADEVEETGSQEAPVQDDAPAQAETTNGTETAEGDAVLDTTMALGEDLYMENCASCHGEDGKGSARVLAGNDNLEYAVLIASQVIHGGEFMPRFPDLTDEEIAAIGTYIRNSWGNELGPVTAEDIAQYR